jgi:hypothetical protein
MRLRRAQRANWNLPRCQYNQDYTQNGHADLGLNLAVGAEPCINPLELSLGIERPSRRVAS